MSICWTRERVALLDSKSRIGRGPSTTVAPYSSLFLRLDSKARTFLAVADCVDEMTLLLLLLLVLLLLLLNSRVKVLAVVTRLAAKRPNDRL